MGWRSLRLDLRLAHFVLESADEIWLQRFIHKRKLLYIQEHCNT